MKALGVATGLLIAIGVFYLLYILLGRAGRHTPSSPGTRSTISTNLTQAPQPEHPLYVPRSREEEVREKLAEKRLPYFRYLRLNYGGIISQFAVRERLDTLDLVVKQDDDETLRLLIQQAIAPSAQPYGFRKVRFFVRNPITSVEPLSLVAESTLNEQGLWITFRK
jgi:hypothetical protein